MYLAASFIVTHTHEIIMASQLLLSATKQNDANASRKKRGGTNVNQKLLTEFQALIAFACYDSPLIVHGGSMRESTMESIMEKHCFGDPPDHADPEILTYGDQFLHGLNKLKGLYEDTATVDTAQDTAVLTMLPSLHCQSGLNIFVGEGSIEKGLLCRKSLTNKKQVITGRTLLRLAKEVLCNCKKMLALVMDATSPYRDGSYPSGMNWDDYARWCLSAMYNSEQSTITPKNAVAVQGSKVEVRNPTEETTAEPSKESIATVMTMNAINNNDDCDDFFDTASTLREQQQDAEQGEDGHESSTRRGEMDNEQQHDVIPLLSTNTNCSFFEGGPPAGYFFKGYLAWCLWGHIPVIQGSYKSKLFTVAKENASSGKDGSRAALKRKAVAAATSGEENNKKKARKNNDNKSEKPAESFSGTTITTTTSGRNGLDTSPLGDGVIGVLTKTLTFMNEESLENELQKNALLKVRRIRDKIAAVSRKHDLLLRRMSRSENGSNNVQQELIEKYETELEQLELQLDMLLDDESERREKVLSARAKTAQHEQTQQRTWQQDDEQQEQRTSRDDGSVSLSSPSSSSAILVPAAPSKDDAGRTGTGDNVPAIAGVIGSAVCSECSVMPTSHKCRKCKERHVCDVCCSTKRDLELVWWCETCFAKETPATQALIRSGNYDSD
jgi:hypothetical protein